MNKNLIRLVGIQIIVVGLVLSIFEFLIENSELVIGIGILTIVVSLFVKR